MGSSEDKGNHGTSRFGGFEACMQSVLIFMCHVIACSLSRVVESIFGET